MAATLGVLDKNYVSGLTLFDEREIMSGIVNVNDVESFCDLWKRLGYATPTKMHTYYHHINRDNFVSGDTTGATIVGSGSAATLTGVTLTAASYGFFRKRDVVRLPNGKQAWVVSVTPGGGQDTLVLQSVDGTNLTLVAGNIIYLSGVAMTENDSNRSPQRFGKDAISNRVQIFSESSTATDIQMMTATTQDSAGKPYYVKEHIEKLKHLQLLMSLAMIQSRVSGDGFETGSSATMNENGYGAQTTRGLDQYIETYGSTRSNTTTNVVVYADISAQQDALISKKAPKSFYLLGATRAFRPLNTYLKGLGSGGVSSVRMNVDGRAVDLQVDQYTDSGFTYKFMPVKTFDHSSIVSTSVIGSCLNYIPEGMVMTDEGAKPYLSLRYLNTSALPLTTGANAKWVDMILETRNGKLTNGNGTQNNASTAWDAWVGLDALAMQHALRERVIF
jgi:hypothetical protein